MNYTVDFIKHEETYDWLLNKHYLKRIPPISFSFGLFDNKKLIGVCTYGFPMSSQLRKVCGEKYFNCFYELNRLCIDGNPKNSASFFVSRTLKMLPCPSVIVSYADKSQGHNGYIYQASNFLYTGLSIEIQDYVVKGLEHLHHTTVGDMVGRSDKYNGEKTRKDRMKEMFGDKLYLKERPRKHRYVFFNGSKTQKKDMLKNLKYEILPYPKGDNTRYDASYKPAVQNILF